jgi:Xaa-Pro aminopeptidase
VSASTLLLLDSGGQYDCGTTDITRTLHLGEPTDYQRRTYTRVLQGHIGLDRVRAAPAAAAAAPLFSFPPTSC